MYASDDENTLGITYSPYRFLAAMNIVCAVLDAPLAGISMNGVSVCISINERLSSL